MQKELKQFQEKLNYFSQEVQKQEFIRDARVRK